jgi:ABC-2 type transport system permease protein/lipopolysaccharide transport system permease protein
MWIALAMQDIRLRYRGSILGPFWLTLSMIIMITAMGAIYAKLFKTDLHEYLPFLTIGLVVWQFVSGAVNEGCQTFLAVGSVVQQVPMPFSIHAYRVVCRNLIIMAHNVVVVPIVLLLFHVPFDWRVLGILPGLLALAICGVWASLLFGILSTRFRDIPPIVANFLQVVFFVTPVFWSPASLGPWKHLAELNPLFAAIDVIRAPLLGLAPAASSWPIMMAMTLVGSAVTFLFFARFRSRIAYWL